MLQFKSSDENPTPKPQDIIINGTKVGTVKPTLEANGALSWHAIINLGCHMFLVQGFGPTPAAAVAHGISWARKEQARRAEKLAQLENSLGVRDLEHEASLLRALEG